MADYYPLIAKAVAGLEKNTGEARRTLYERARSALVAQLRSVSPALSESEITRERLALEEAIRRVEADAARRARAESSAGRRGAEPAPTPPPTVAAPPRTTPVAPPPPHADEPAPPPPPAASDAAPGEEGRAPERTAPSDEGLKGLRDVVAEAESLGDATAQGAKAARDAFAATAPGRNAPRMEPHIEPDELRPRPPPRPPRPPRPPAEPGDEAGEAAAADRAEPPLLREAARTESSKLITGRERGLPWPGSPPPPPPAGGSEDRADDRPAGGERAREPGAGRPFPLRPPPEEESFDETESGALQRRSFVPPASVLIGIVALVVLLGFGALLYRHWPTIAALWKSPQVATAPKTPATAPSTKMTDRVGAPAASDSQQAETANVAQRVVLYEEDPSNPAVTRHVGTVIWRTESSVPAPGQPPDTIIRADIEIPDPHITVKWSLRRNTDKALPASHTIEIIFTLPPDFPPGNIANIPGILMKQAEQTRGVPLAGLSVKVTDGFFLIGLSSAEADMKRNIALLKERAWFDIPVVYKNGRRAILALEKGTPGDRVFNEAFAAWGQ